MPKVSIEGLGEFQVSETVAYAVVVLLKAQENCIHGSFDVPVYLTFCGPQKIATIKAVRQVTGLNLKDAKGLCDQVDMGMKKLLKRVPYDDAMRIRDIFRVDAPNARLEIADPLTLLAMQAP